MNDPGVDAPISDAAKDMEHDPYTHEEQQEEEEERDFLDPSRWWFASTACPLIAGTFGPMANAFSICALGNPWRVYIPPGNNEVRGQPIKDPKWLIAINAIQLVFALMANMSLLLNMARRLSFAIAQPITIIGFMMSSLLLISLVSVASTSTFKVPPQSDHALSQAYYYAIIAAVIYFIIAGLMVVTVVGAYRGHYEKEFRLTVSQRTLMLQTIAFMVYLMVGALVYSTIESWNFLDALYWADFTLLTVGIGSDFTPLTHLGRGLLFPYAIGGIVTIGLVVGSIRTLVLDRGKHKMETRMTEKKRERVLNTIDPENRTIQIGRFSKVDFSQKGLSEAERREQEFYVMRNIQTAASDRRRWMALGVSTLAAATLWFVGAVVFWQAERQQGWSYFVALYFSYTSLLTIGYGDYQPESNSGRPFFVFWTLLAVPTLTILISNMGDTVVKSFSNFTIWVGSLTVLPGEEGIRATLIASFKKITQGNVLKRDGVEVQQPPGLIPRGENTSKGGRGQTNHPYETEALNRIAEHIEDEELEEAAEAGKEGDDLERDIHFYHFVLIRELRKLMKDVDTSPPKQYSYNEWAFYLKLIGQDEGDPNLHRAPPIKVEQNRKIGAAKNKGANDTDESDEEKTTENNSGAVESDAASESHMKIGIGGGGGELKQWSWLGTRSPLMGNQNEAEWILERLAATLERQMAKMRKQSKGEPGALERPPVSMRELRKRGVGGERSEREKKDEDEGGDVEGQGGKKEV
ncbi:voltage-gated potassium channel [Aulographum hederae CBS 113979]|uniref:Voltage-gated potassium channel n=1 Tax=Aulographum hederae CBS 113979 TaxID=1176131 RepID=A0A6G1HGG6_9PEZI|nr:voltage-gated potassium channel [Aulographum hederae CBS 113979]